jgi:hypothetical protein
MIMPIEKTPHGILTFLKCGCAVVRLLEHPTGAAFLVDIRRACDSHAGDQIRSIMRGELVSPLTKQLDQAS